MSIESALSEADMLVALPDMLDGRASRASALPHQTQASYSTKPSSSQ